MTPFDKLKQKLDEACASLRGFTLGHPGFTQQDGLITIARVKELCCRIESLGKKDKHALYAVSSARNQVLAARARLVILQKRDAAVTRNGVTG
jgi:hypothetical protein